VTENHEGLAPVPPEPVGLVPSSVVEGLVAQNEADFEELRAELAVALREAELAEKRLWQDHPAALVYDATFAADVEGFLTEWTGSAAPPWRPAVSEEDSAPPPFAEVQSLLTDAPSEESPPPPVAVPRYDPARPRFPNVRSLLTDATTNVADATSNGATDSSAAPVGSSAPDSTGSPLVEGGPTAAPPPESASSPGSPTPPAGVVMSAPSTERQRTTVVVRNAALQAPLPPPPPITAPPTDDSPRWATPAQSQPASSSTPASGQHPSHGPNDDLTVETKRATSSHWTQRVPSRLLIQLGILVVIVGLIVLKLG